MPNLKVNSQTVLCANETVEPTEYNDTIICHQNETEESLWS
jgi:hypothetical protein